MRQPWGLLLTAVLLVILVGCGGAPAGTGGGTGSGGGDPANGEQVFNTGGTSGIPCASCHTLNGTDLVGPTMQGIGTIAGERVSGQSAEEYLRESIVNPSRYVVEGYDDIMNKDYGTRLSEQEIADLIAFLLTQ
ncbi:MAG: hypothetical protein Kow00124_19400 [Anaerolineae bacterium]